VVGVLLRQERERRQLLIQILLQPLVGLLAVLAVLGLASWLDHPLAADWLLVLPVVALAAALPLAGLRWPGLPLGP
jgi:hypothetical protein